MESIKVGDLVPDAYVYEEYPTNKISIREILCEKRVILVGFIGAFVPVCSRNFLVDYIEQFEKLKEDLQVDEICAIAVQDAFVLHAFRKCINKDCRIRFLADQDASFVRAMGLSFDAPLLSSVRSKRFSMIVDKGVVCELNVEPDAIGLTISAADKLGKEKPKPVAYPELLKQPLPKIPSNNATIKQPFHHLEEESLHDMKNSSPRGSLNKQESATSPGKPPSPRLSRTQSFEEAAE